MSKRYIHVHVYRVTGMLECGFGGFTEREALAAALKDAKKVKLEKWDEPDCEYLAMIPGGEDNVKRSDSTNGG